MKKILLLTAATVAVFFTGCSKPEVKEDPIQVSLEVTDIADNCATVSAKLTSGDFYGAKIIEDMNIDDVTIDYTNDLQLVKFVEQNGKDVTLPYEVKLTGVRIGNDRFSAVIAYDKNGVAKSVAVQVWTPEGRPDGWSTENNPGDLGEIIW